MFAGTDYAILYTWWVKKKFTRLMRHNIASIVSILKTWLGLDRQDFKLDYDAITFHFTSLFIELLKSGSHWNFLLILCE